MRSSHDHPTSAGNAKVGHGHAALATGFSSRPCYSWPLSPRMHIFAFSYQTRYRVAATLYPCIHDPCPAHQFGTKSEHPLAPHLIAIEHRLGLPFPALPCLALPCTRPDPHAAFACSASMHASPGVGLGWLVCFWPGLAWPAIDDLTNIVLMKKQKEEQQTSAATATTSADSTTTSTSHLQTTVSTAVSMNHPRRRW